MSDDKTTADVPEPEEGEQTTLVPEPPAEVVGPDGPETAAPAPEPEDTAAQDAPAESPAPAPAEPSGLSQEAEDAIRANVQSGAITNDNLPQMTFAIADMHGHSLDAVRAFVHRVWDELRGGTA